MPHPGDCSSNSQEIKWQLMLSAAEKYQKWREWQKASHPWLEGPQYSVTRSAIIKHSIECHLLDNNDNAVETF